ncbi:hypothetical protein GDO81_029548 [Engystomops pustulosus]|uniref:Uncharacterized protein n=1 Tax=Engystomops pustulosus TaxID=76066 RepID=A0AAV6YVP3_ENGPU|nr:hypothetical protein GDO81_029548 [Engystomops pustulosus]
MINGSALQEMFSSGGLRMDFSDQSQSCGWDSIWFNGCLLVIFDGSMHELCAGVIKDRSDHISNPYCEPRQAF